MTRKPFGTRSSWYEVYLGIQRGDLVRPAECEQCRIACKPDAAHYDYNEPLRVRWLCRKCHRRWDVAVHKPSHRIHTEAA
jgi:hypothetical protein